MQKKADHLSEGAQVNSSSIAISFNPYIVQQRRRNSCKICPLTYDKAAGISKIPKSVMVDTGDCSCYWNIAMGYMDNWSNQAKYLHSFLKSKLLRLLCAEKKVLKYR